jgi:hypothetical protein
MREQRCWVHKTANVLNRLPKSQHTKTKRALQAVWMAADDDLVLWQVGGPLFQHRWLAKANRDSGIVNRSKREPKYLTSACDLFRHDAHCMARLRWFQAGRG